MSNENVLVNPFPGLRAFEEEEDILFFGREKQIDELLRKLRTSRFLAIIGSSGSGKSSLVKSGLLPSLHSGLMSGVGSQWKIALFRPGNDPIGQLNEALCKNGILRDNQSAEELQTNIAINESILRRSNLGLIESYKQSGLDKKNNLLILVDQFEELFRFSKYEKDAGEGKRDSIAFINLLLKAAEQKEVPIYVVFTMRSDFLGDCTEFRGLPEAINEGQYLVPRMTREERREAITGPIAVGGATITPALLNRLLNDVGDNPDQLPILQHALMRTWDIWKKKNKPAEPLDIDDYEHIGTISEALSQHAEEAYSELTSDRERLLAEVLFKELTDKGGLSSGIRRPRMLSELCAAADATEEEMIKVIEVFRKPGRGFLMPAYPVALTSKSIIDISHESIMRVWKRLIGWLEEEEESAQVYMHLCEAVDLYEAGKGGLWRDPELQIAIKWRDEQNKNAAWASRYNNYFDKVIFFLDHSRQKRDLEILHKEELQRQRLRNTRRVSIVVSVIALIAFLFGAWALNLQIVAKKAEARAKEKEKYALVKKQEADVSRADALKAKQVAEIAKDSAETNREKALAEEKNALLQKGIAEEQSRKAKMEQANAEKSANEAEVSRKKAEENATIAEKNRAEAEKNRLNALREKDKAEKLQKVAESKNFAHKATTYMNANDYENCRKLALTAYDNNLANQGEFQDDDIYGALYISWENAINDKNTFRGHSSPVRALAGLPNSNIIFSGDESGRIIVSEAHDGVLTQKFSAAPGGEVRSLVTNAVGDYLLAVMFKEAVLYKVNGDHSLKKQSSVKFIGNGKHGAFIGSEYFIVQTSEGLIRYNLNNPDAGKDTLKLTNCLSLATGSDGKIFVGAGKSIYEYMNWEGTKRAPANTYSLPSHVTSICIDKSGRYLAAGTYSGVVWFKDISRPGSVALHSSIHKSAVNDVVFCTVANGHLQLASASSDKSVKITEVTSEHTLKFDNTVTINDHTNWVYGLVYTPDGKFLFSCGEDEIVVGKPTTMAYLYNALTSNK